MNKGLREYLDRIGAKPVDPKTLAHYERKMREEVIPAIDRDMKANRRAAHFARLGIPDPLLKDERPC